jgi:hypothetical protein
MVVRFRYAVWRRGERQFDFTTMERNGKSRGAAINDLNIDDDQNGLAAEDGEAFPRGLSCVQEDVVGSTLNPSWYFEGGRGNNKDDPSGIYPDSGGAGPLVGTTGQLWYNPTSHIAHRTSTETANGLPP